MSVKEGPSFRLLVRGQQNLKYREALEEALKDKGPMQLYGMYLGHKGAAMFLLWDLCIYYNDTWTLWERQRSPKQEPSAMESPTSSRPSYLPWER